MSRSHKLHKNKNYDKIDIEGIRAIIYVGHKSHFVANVKRRMYEFEWQKSVAVGSRPGEVRPEDATSLLKKRDARGKKIFILDE